METKRRTAWSDRLGLPVPPDHGPWWGRTGGAVSLHWGTQERCPSVWICSDSTRTAKLDTRPFRALAVRPPPDLGLQSDNRTPPFLPHVCPRERSHVMETGRKPALGDGHVGGLSEIPTEVCTSILLGSCLARCLYGNENHCMCPQPGLSGESPDDSHSLESFL